MNEDEEDIFIIGSSPERNTATRNSVGVNHNGGVGENIAVVAENIAMVAENNLDENVMNIQTSPIIATSRYSNYFSQVKFV